MQITIICAPRKWPPSTSLSFVLTPSLLHLLTLAAGHSFRCYSLRSTCSRQPPFENRYLYSLRHVRKESVVYVICAGRNTLLTFPYRNATWYWRNLWTFIEIFFVVEMSSYMSDESFGYRYRYGKFIFRASITGPFSCVTPYICRPLKGCRSELESRDRAMGFAGFISVWRWMET